MYPVIYRKFETYEMMTCCQTIWSGELHSIRWFELRKDSIDWYVYQSGNYSPDGASRYMPSMSVNGSGDIALGFTKSSLEINPSIWITGRQISDTLAVMSYQEFEIFHGMSYANNLLGGWNRWGDYSCMMVDPADDLTFWYTSMYTIDHTDYGNWSTRITKFQLDNINRLENKKNAELELIVYPSPAYGISNIRYRIPVGNWQLAIGNKVQLSVFDIHGRKIKTLINEEQIAGKYVVMFDGSDLPAGVYLVCLTTPFNVISEKLILLK